MMLIGSELLLKTIISLKATRDVKSLWISNDSWISVAIEGDVIVAGCHVEDKERKQTHERVKGLAEVQLFVKNN